MPIRFGALRAVPKVASPLTRAGVSMPIFENLSLWCAQQQPFWATVYFALFFSLGISLLVLMTNANLATLRRSGLHRFWVLYLFLKGLSQIPHALPLDVLLGEAVARFISLSLSLLCVCTLIWTLVMALRSLFSNLHRAFLPLVGLGAILFIPMAILLPAGLSHGLTGCLECLLLLGNAAVLIYCARSWPRRLRRQGMWIALPLVAFSLLDWVVWTLPAHFWEGFEMYRFLGLLEGVIAFAALNVGCNELLGEHAIHSASRKNTSHRLVALEWFGVLLLLFWGLLASNSMIRNVNDDNARDMEADLGVVAQHLRSLQTESFLFVEILSRNPSLVALLEGDRSYARSVSEALDRYARVVPESRFYFCGTDGICVDSSNRSAPESFVGLDLTVRAYITKALKGSASAEFLVGINETRIGSFIGFPVYSADRSRIIGALGMKRALTSQDILARGRKVVLFDYKGDAILFNDPIFSGRTQRTFETEPREALLRIPFSDKDYRVIRLKEGAFLFSRRPLGDDRSSVGILEDARGLFLGSVPALFTLAFVLILFSASFSFIRYAIARGDYELSQAKEFKEILAANPNCIGVLDRDYMLLRVEGSGVPFMGHSQEELLGTYFLNLWPAESALNIKTHLRQAFRGERTTFESQYIHPDGHQKHFFIFCAPLYNSEGQISSIVAIWMDITSRKKMEEELRGRLELERTLFSVTEEFLVAGVSDKAALQRSLEHLRLFAQADSAIYYKALPTGALSNFCEVRRNGLPTVTPVLTDTSAREIADVFPMQELRAGHVVNMGNAEIPEAEIYMAMEGLSAFLAVPLFERGVFVGCIRLGRVESHEAWKEAQAGFVKNICEAIQGALQRSQTQERLRLLDMAIQQIEDGILITEETPGGTPRVVFINPAVCRNTGYTPEEILGRSPEEKLVSPRSIEEGMIPKRSEFPAKKADRIEFYTLRKDGSEYLTEMTLSFLTDLNGRVTHSISIARDISRQREMQMRLSLSSKLESIGQLAAGIAHEINTPAQFITDNLFFIKAHWEKIADVFGDDPVKAAERIADPRFQYVVAELPNAINDALEGIQRIATIVSAMREFSHSAGEKNRADLNKAIETTIVVARNEWKYCAQIKTELAPDLPLVNCYISDINQVVLNLIVNAAHAIQEKYKDAQQGLITLRTRLQDASVIIEVEDDGPGIPEKIREKIYDPFFTTKAQGKGTGQGLYIARRVVTERHNGTLELESQPGKGAKFIITLPLE